MDEMIATSHWPFVIAAYGVAFAILAGLLVQSMVKLRRAEKGLEDFRSEKRG